MSRFFMHPSIANTNDHAILVGPRSAEQMVQLVVDSRFGVVSTHSTQSTYTNINEVSTLFATPVPTTIPLETRLAKVKSMTVRACEFPVQFDQYSTALQNTSFAVGTGGVGANESTSSIVTIPDGNYTATQIASTLSDISGTNLSFYVNNRGRIEARNLSSEPVLLSFSVTPDATFDRYRLKQKLGWGLGFRQARYDIPAGGTVEAEGVFQQQTVRYVYLVVNDFVMNRRTTLSTCAPQTNGGDVIARITLDSTRYPHASILPATEANGYLLSGVRTYSGESANIDRLAVHFCDEYGRALYLNEADFSAVLEIEYC
jgi:hypothetical protein